MIRERNVRDCRRLLVGRIDAEDVGVGRHSDDGEPLRLLVFGESEPPTHRIAIGPEPGRHGLIDHRDRRVRPAFGLREVAPARRHEPERRVEVRRDTDEGNAGAFVRYCGPPVHDYRAAASAIAEWDKIRSERGAHARERLDPSHHILNSPELGILGLVHRTGHEKPHAHERSRIEPEIGCAEIHERPDEQQCADERHERKRHLHDNQRTSQRRPGDAVAARAFLQRLVQVSARGLQRRKQSKHERRRRGDGHGVRDRPPVQLPPHVVRHLVWRHAGGNQPRANCGQRDAEGHADQAEHDTFGEQLPDNAAAARTERRAHGDLAAPARGPRQKEIGDVRAGDEQHERDAGHHQIENERDLIGQKRLAERAEVRAPAFIRSRVLGGQAAGDRVEILAHPFDGHARLHPAKRKQAASAARILRYDGLERNPEPLIVGKSKPGRHHANHDVRLAVDRGSILRRSAGHRGSAGSTGRNRATRPDRLRGDRPRT